MPHASNRLQRVADQLQRALAELLTSKANDPRFQQLSVTGVEISPDMAHAKIFVSQLDEAHIKKTLAALNHAAGFLRYQLAHSLNLRITPQLKFVFDDSISRGSHISKLINDAR